MKKFLTIILLGLINGFSAFSQTTMSSLSTLEWLIGKWERTDVKAGQTSYENWTRNTPDEFVGIGITLQGIDTVFVENLKFVVDQDTVYYVAEVSHNPAPVYFRLTKFSQSGFVSENPNHDFPKKIEYRLDNNSLVAIISGNGESRQFHFQKVPD